MTIQKETATLDGVAMGRLPLATRQALVAVVLDAPEDCTPFHVGCEEEKTYKASRFQAPTTMKPWGATSYGNWFDDENYHFGGKPGVQRHTGLARENTRQWEEERRAYEASKEEEERIYQQEIDEEMQRQRAAARYRGSLPECAACFNETRMVTDESETEFRVACEWCECSGPRRSSPERAVSAYNELFYGRGL